MCIQSTTTHIAVDLVLLGPRKCNGLLFKQNIRILINLCTTFWKLFSQLHFHIGIFVSQNWPTTITFCQTILISHIIIFSITTIYKDIWNCIFCSISIFNIYADVIILCVFVRNNKKKLMFLSSLFFIVSYIFVLKNIALLLKFMTWK